jgi:RNA polymerase sigma-70 factor (ECF subfamily)
VGHERRAEDIYVALAPAVLGYLRAERVPDPDDLLGEVFLQVARDLRRFQGDDAAVRRWVFTIAHNRIVDDVRRRTRRPLRLVDRVPERAAASTDEPFDPVLVAALHQLTPGQREVVVLRFVADLSIDDVAELTKQTPGAVKAMQHRALEKLARCVSPDAPAALTE